jgi:hypothetical protein
MTGSMDRSNRRRWPDGARVQVRNRFDGEWASGFEVEGQPELATTVEPSMSSADCQMVLSCRSPSMRETWQHHRHELLLPWSLVPPSGVLLLGEQGWAPGRKGSPATPQPAAALVGRRHGPRRAYSPASAALARPSRVI